MPDTPSNNALLNRAFDDETIISSDLDTLKRLLLACTEMREEDITNPRVKEGLPKRTEFIKQLIALKQSEISQSSLVTRSNWTIGISVGTFLILAIKTGFELWSR